MKTGNTGIKRILMAFKYSWQGFTATVKTEAAFRQELCLCIPLGIVAVMLPLPPLQIYLLLFSLLLIILMELVNSAIEAVIDRISDEYHELSKKAKDIGSLLVLLAFINAFAIWGICLWQLYL
ncbi:MAG: diacylglycerol kinase [Alphaproteobacteria bacterium]|nr:diacylglycerol kinase [Alphaproteobacteria bacterium]